MDLNVLIWLILHIYIGRCCLLYCYIYCAFAEHESSNQLLSLFDYLSIIETVDLQLIIYFLIIFGCILDMLIIIIMSCSCLYSRLLSSYACDQLLVEPPISRI